MHDTNSRSSLFTLPSFLVSNPLRPDCSSTLFRTGAIEESKVWTGLTQPSCEFNLSSSAMDRLDFEQLEVRDYIHGGDGVGEWCVI